MPVDRELKYIVKYRACQLIKGLLFCFVLFSSQNTLLKRHSLHLVIRNKSIINIQRQFSIIAKGHIQVKFATPKTPPQLPPHNLWYRHYSHNQRHQNQWYYERRSSRIRKKENWKKNIQENKSLSKNLYQELISRYAKQIIPYLLAYLPYFIKNTKHTIRFFKLLSSTFCSSKIFSHNT